MASQIEGLKELERKLAALGPAAGGKALRNANTAAMRVVRKAAKQNAPVGIRDHKTYKGRQVSAGFVKRSIRVRGSISRDKTTATAKVGVTAEAFYAAQFVELGTKYQPARPWLRPALYQNKDQVLQTLKDRLKLQIDKARKK